jgi:hypothetical protein
MVNKRRKKAKKELDKKLISMAKKNFALSSLYN